MVEIKNFLKDIVKKHHLENEKLRIYIADTRLDTTRIKDYPLMKGKEFLLRADFKGFLGDAFTNKLVEFEGKLKDILNMENPAVIISTLNAVMRYLNLIDKTVHCQKDEPEKCAKRLVDFLKNLKFNKLGVIGFQPAFVKTLVENFSSDRVYVTDMNPENIGKTKYGAKILSEKDNEYLFQKCDLILATGSSVVNGTFWDIYDLSKKYKKRVIFYGTSIAGIAKLLNLERFCTFAK